MQKPRTHFVPEYFGSPVHPLTVDLVGCGGSGSIMYSCLASINSALIRTGRPGLQVTAYDDDEVSEANLGRQLFPETELGCNKANALTTRFNRVFGTSWDAVPEKYRFNPKTNIIISCTDNLNSRRYIAREFRKEKPANTGEYGTNNEMKNYYWLDLGNSQKKGQAVLGSATIRQPHSQKFESVDTLPLVTERFSIKKKDEKESGPSCSLAEALKKQDLFINRAVATMGADILWQLLNKGHIENCGFFLNLEDFRMVPIEI